MIYLEIVIIVLICIMLFIGIVLIIKNKKHNDVSYRDISKDIISKIEQGQNLLLLNDKNKDENFILQLKIITDSQIEQLKAIERKLEYLTQNNNQKLESVTKTIDGNLKIMLENNEKKLEQMRQTVDEKLSSVLEKRLNASFEIISKNLDAVQMGLGEMRNLAVGVGDLKKVLSNVKNRGVYGELWLGTLLEQVLSPVQYDKEVQLNENNLERVDYVIKLPGKDDKELLLPIDAKFPIEDYNRLVDSFETGDTVQIEKASKQLERRIKEEAKKIKEKYIIPPKTTDFAIMYLPLEGLYAEVVKQPGIMESLQNDYKVTVCGPTTFTALLNSLQLGFRSLTIEKRSSEIWNLLTVFKQEFGKFVTLLNKTQLELGKASDSIDKATKKSEKIQSKLDKVILTSEDKNEIDYTSDDGVDN